jgi:hypothetical protein
MLSRGSACWATAALEASEAKRTTARAVRIMARKLVPRPALVSRQERLGIRKRPHLSMRPLLVVRARKL